MTNASNKLAMAIKLKIDDSERIEVGDEHCQLNWFPTMDKMANTKEAASSSW